MKKIITAAAFAVVASGAFAQASNFEGFSGALNLNTVSINTKITANNAGTFDGIGQQSFNGSAQVAYGFVASPGTVVSVGGTYALGNAKGGTFTAGNTSGEFRAKNAYSFYVEPGFLLNDKTLAYGKLSYESAKGTAASTGQAEASKSLNGTGFGAGIRTMLSKTSFIQVEFKQVGYGGIDIANAGSLTTKATVGTIGFGMKF